MSMNEIVRGIALERIRILFMAADKEFSEHPNRSRRYVELALKIGKKCNVPVPQELKKNYCKKCGAFLKEGRNSKIRISAGIMKITCTECNATKKIAVKRERKQVKKNQARKTKK